MNRPSLLLAGLASLLAACARSAAPGAMPAPGAPAVLYVCNQNDATVSVIDTRTHEVVRTVELQRLGFSANAKPHHVAVEPDGSYWYVTLIGENRIVKLDREDRVVGQVAFETPGMLALHPDRDLLFVGRSMTAVNPPRRIGVIRRSDMTLEEIEVVFPRPHALALEPRSNTVYTASLAANQLAVVDVASEAVRVLDVEGPAHALMQFAVSPDGRLLAVSGELSGVVLLFDITRPLEPQRVATITVGRQPFDPVFTRDGRFLYLGNKADNSIAVIDVGARRLATTITAPAGIAQPHGTAVSPDGRWVYVSNNNTGQAHDMSNPASHAAHTTAPAPGRGTLVVIDAATHRLARVIEVGHNASGIAVPTVR